jgi:molybdate transport system permease protein
MFDHLTAEEWTAVGLSLRVGFWSVAASLPLGIGLAYLLARAEFPGKRLLDGLVHLPLVLPPVVTGYVLLLAFGRHGFIGQLLQQAFGVSVMFRWTGAAIAAALMGLPLMVRAIRLSIEAIDPRLEMAARSLGGSAWHVFFTVTLPLALPGLIAGAILSFARSLGEFGATITFVSNIPGETQTLPLAIYSLLQRPDADAAVFRLSVIAVILAFATLLAADWVTRRFGAGARP